MFSLNSVNFLCVTIILCFSDGASKPEEKSNTIKLRLIASPGSFARNNNRINNLKEAIRVLRKDNGINAKSQALEEELPKLSLKNTIKSFGTAKHITSVTYFTYGISDRNRDEAIKIVRNVLKDKNTKGDIALRIRKDLEKVLKIKCNCIVGAKGDYGQSFIKIPGTATMTFGFRNEKTVGNEVIVTVFTKAKKNQLQKDMISNAKSAAPEIIDTTMDTAMIIDLVTIASRVMKTSKNMNSISNGISNEFDHKYDGHWHTVLGHRNHFVMDNNHKFSKSYAILDFGDIRVAVYKNDALKPKKS